LQQSLLYFVQIGYYSLEIAEPMANRLSLAPAYLRCHTGKDPLEGEVEAFAELILRANARADEERAS
jgi:hypothetical protein